MKKGKSKMGIRETVQEIASDATVASAATKYGMIGGTGTSITGWLASSGAAVLIGIAVTIAGFIVNLYYQRKRNQREHALWLIRMENERKGGQCEI